MVFDMSGYNQGWLKSKNDFKKIDGVGVSKNDFKISFLDLENDFKNPKVIFVEVDMDKHHIQEAVNMLEYCKDVFPQSKPVLIPKGIELVFKDKDAALNYLEKIKKEILNG